METIEFNEGKIIVMGYASVGKTTLVKRLLYDKVIEKEPRTDGIDISRWELNGENKDIRFTIWDFGGQLIMHSAHDFFLTEKTLYLIVIDSRADQANNSIDHWYKIIQTYASGSPIMVVCNKSDEHPLDLPEESLKKKYPQIKSIVNGISAINGTKIEELKTEIWKEVERGELLYKEIPASWLEVKKMIEAKKMPFLDSKEFEKICNSKGINTEKERKSLINLFHNLGIVLNYNKYYQLELRHILDPEWISTGVYKILTSCELKTKKGKIEKDDFSRILIGIDSKKYPVQDHGFIIDIMKKFGLCFSCIEENKEIFFIPDLFCKDEPPIICDITEWNDALSFELHYNILPPRVISTFVVEMHEIICLNAYWYSGAILKRNGCTALVRADIADNKIFIRIRGKDIRENKNFLFLLRNKFATIQKTFGNIEYKEKVPIPGHPEIPPADYNNLLDMENAGIREYMPPGMKETVKVSDLLDGIGRETEGTGGEKGKRENQFWYWMGIPGLFLFFIWTFIKLASQKEFLLKEYLLIFFAGVSAATIILFFVALFTGKLSEKGFLEIAKESLKKIPGIGTFFSGK